MFGAHVPQDIIDSVSGGFATKPVLACVMIERARISLKANRKWKNCFSPFLNRGRKAIERMFHRLKVFRRIATCYDRNAVTFLAAICIAAAASYFMNLNHNI